MDIMSKEQRSQRMALIRSKNTKPEMLVRSAIHRMGYRFRLHRKDLPGNPDLVFPGRRCVIFVDGCFWHGHECPVGHIPSSNSQFWLDKISRTKLRDSTNRKLLKQAGWRVLVLWECQIKDPEQLERKVRGLMQNPTGT